MSKQDKAFSLVIDSLFFAIKMNDILYHNLNDEKIKIITGLAWKRHWRRVKKAIDTGLNLEIPDTVND